MKFQGHYMWLPEYWKDNDKSKYNLRSSGSDKVAI